MTTPTAQLAQVCLLRGFLAEASGRPSQ